MDPFTSKDIFELKEVNFDAERVWHGFRLEADLESESLHLAEVEEIRIPDLKSNFLRLSVDDGSLDSLDLSGSASSITEPDTGSPSKDKPDHNLEIEIWNAPNLLQRQPKHGLLNWDLFNGHSTDELDSRYLSESGEAAYDAIQSHEWHEEHQESLKYARLDHFTQAVLNVLLGRSSLLFEWNDFSRSFETQLDNIALVGHSTQLVATICKMFCACGTSFKTIQAFCQSHKPTNATVFAAQSSLTKILNAIETNLLRDATLRSTLPSLHRISSKFGEIYEALRPIVEVAQSPREESYVLSTIIQYVDEVWASNPFLRPFFTNLADRILQPSIRDTYQRTEVSTTTSNTSKDTEWVLARLMPDCEEMFQDILKCIYVGNDNGMQIRQFSCGAQTSQLAHYWADVVELQYQADFHEIDSRKKLEDFCSGNSPTTKRNIQTEGIDLFNQSPFKIDFQTSPSNPVALQQSSEEDTRLSRLVLATITDKETGPEPEPELSPMQMLDMSLRPILTVQHRTCSYALMRSLFLQHDLVAYLELLHAYHLFGNGYFASRLSRALFDTSQNSAEGRRNTGLTAGLRLEDREIWPPASSELRFVLMGLLSESPNIGDSSSIIDSISFAIRDLSDEDMELCRDVHSVHALDFLRLTYASPNSVLELIITPSVLESYDRIFKFLLVLLRMHAFSQSLMSAVVSLTADSNPNKQYHRFCLQLHHFAMSFLDYALNVAINVPGKKMLQCFKEVHDSLRTENYDRCLSIAGSISQLCKMHEDALNEMLAALFLETSQAKLLAATFEIFRIGLDFARNGAADGINHDSTVHYKQLHHALDNWLSLARKSSGDGRDREFRIIDHLLIKFDHSRY